MAGRDPSLDFVKGVLIWLVVLGHAIEFGMYAVTPAVFGDPVFVFIYMFHMPLFIGVAGYVFDVGKARGVPFAALVRGRAHQLLMPMVVWVMLLFTSNVLLVGSGGNVHFSSWGTGILSGLAKSYWFLWAAFLSTTILTALARLPLPLWFSAPVMALGLAAAPFDLVPHFGYSLWMTSFMFPFFIAGYGLSRCSGPWPRATLVLSLAGFATFYALWRPEFFAYINQMRLLDLPLDVLATLLGGAAASIAMVVLLRGVYRRWPNGAVTRWFLSAGHVTLQIYLAQTLVFWAVKRVLDPAPYEIAYPLAILASIVASVVIVTLLIWFIRRTSEIPMLGGLLWGRSAGRAWRSADVVKRA